MAKVLLEAPVFTIEAAIQAASYGIDRIELCSNFMTGGETPSAGSFQYLRKKISIPIFVMIRPRGGDFVYSEDEIHVMMEDIRILSNLGADGFVFGVLSPDGKLDMKNNKALIKCAGNLPCTLHRAFDSTVDLFEAMDDAIACGFQRILTSGGENTVSEGLDNLLSLLKLAGDKIIVLPGGGLIPEHLSELYSTGNLKEVHASCKGFRVPDKIYRKPGLMLTQEENILTVDGTAVKSFRKTLTKLY